MGKKRGKPSTPTEIGKVIGKVKKLVQRGKEKKRSPERP